MTAYIVGAVLAIIFVLAARSYFGKKFGNACRHSCDACPRAKFCREKKENIDKSK